MQKEFTPKLFSLIKEAINKETITKDRPTDELSEFWSRCALVRLCITKIVRRLSEIKAEQIKFFLQKKKMTIRVVLLTDLRTK